MSKDKTTPTEEPKAEPEIEIETQDGEVRPLTSVVTLPSCGYLYGELLPEGKVELSSMTTQEEKIIAGGAGSSVAKLNLLLKRTCQLPKLLPPPKLLLTDQYYLLLMIRALSFGSEYGFTVKCDDEDCKVKFRHTVDLITGISVDRAAEFYEEPFTAELPHCGKTLLFRQLRGEDEDRLGKGNKHRFQKGAVLGDPQYVKRIAMHVVSVEGEDVNFDQAHTFVGKLVSKDSLALKRRIEAESTGVNNLIEVECPNCENEIETGLPMSAEFFRPPE